MADPKLSGAVRCLIDFENYIARSAFDKHWEKLRFDFICSVQGVKDISSISVLFRQLRLLENHVKPHLKTNCWKGNQRDDWLAMTDPDLEILHDISHFITALKVFEQNLFEEAHMPAWTGITRDEWLRKCDALFDPLLHVPVPFDSFPKCSMTSSKDDWVEVTEADIAPFLFTSREEITPCDKELEATGHSQAPGPLVAADAIEEAIQCLKELESNIPKSEFSEEWESLRHEFISSLDKINDIKTINILFWELRAFDSHLKYHKKTDIASQWELMYWKILTDVQLELSYTVTRFIITLKFLESTLLENTLTDDWKNSKRDQWLSKCNALIDPLLQLHFYEELLLTVNDILKHFGYDSFKAYEDELDNVITFINSAAQALDKVNTGTGIADTTSGALGIAAGVLGGVGLILAPFTAGASTILTLTSLGVGVGSASTSLTSVIVQKVSNKKKLAEVQQQTEKITAETMALVKVLENHANSVDELKAKLKSLGKTGAMKYIRDVGSASSNLIFGGNNIFGIVTVARQIATQGFKTSVAFESAVPTVFRGTSSLASAASIFSGILSVVGIGFGIFGAILGAKKIKNGSELAKNLRELTENLTFAKDEIRISHEKAIDTLVNCSAEIDDDIVSVPEST